MSSLALLAASPPLLSAALAAAAPGEPAKPQVEIVPVVWSLASAQDATLPQDSAPPKPDPQLDENGQPIDEIVVKGEVGPPKSDPAEAINETSFEVSHVVDRVFVEPVAYAYGDGLPEPIRDGLGNVVRNLGEPSNALNFLLQGKVGKAFETLGRLAINSTLGIGGLIDIAGKPGIGLPYRRNGFANTLGYYGVGPGPYLYLPLTGPTTVRDQIGITLDQALLPSLIGSPFDKPAYAISYFAINGLESRLRDDPELARIKASDDPYVARRESYLAQRRRDIAALKGKAIEDRDDYWGDLNDAAPPSPAPAAPASKTDGPVVPPSGGPEALLITQPR